MKYVFRPVVEKMQFSCRSDSVKALPEAFVCPKTLKIAVETTRLNKIIFFILD